MFGRFNLGDLMESEESLTRRSVTEIRTSCNWPLTLIYIYIILD